MPVVDALRGAVAFLTRLPVGRAPLDVGDVARGAALFPVVGAGIGAAAGGVAVLLHPRLPALLAAALAVTLELVLTGALHVDGLGDTADALAASTRERALEIMRDPRVGSFGAAAIGLDLLVRIAAIAALLERGGAFVSLVVAAALARAAVLPLAAGLPYARPGGGLSERIAPASAVVGAAAAAAFAIGLAGGIGGAMLAGAVVATILLALVYRRRFGGVTGDALGAAVEVTGVVTLLVAVALR